MKLWNLWVLCFPDRFIFAITLGFLGTSSSQLCVSHFPTLFHHFAFQLFYDSLSHSSQTIYKTLQNLIFLWIFSVPLSLFPLSLQLSFRLFASKQPYQILCVSSLFPISSTVIWFINKKRTETKLLTQKLVNLTFTGNQSRKVSGLTIWFRMTWKATLSAIL